MDSSVLIAPEPKPDGILLRLRNMWEFASLMQYIYFFGRVVKIDEDLDVEVRTLKRPRAQCPQ